MIKKEYIKPESEVYWISQVVMLHESLPVNPQDPDPYDPSLEGEEEFE